MTINERVSDERIANLIEVLSFYSPEDKRLANNESELASALRELQQYRSAAEPVCPKCGGTGMADSGGFYPWGEPIFIECDCHAAPQLPQPAVQAEPLSVDALANVLRNAPDAPSDNQGKKLGNFPATPDGLAEMLRRWLSFGRGMQKAGSQIHRHLIAETEAMLAAAPKQEAE
ncbi:hypothetical protein [Atlantibacter hermannii]|uniref:hypothetical protein n=1 Tax=Atlantibacter hermannii TaxID=565 RepID=UPI0028ABD261|nr:hypothetical protein [Atlantibacter hermannii]